MVLFDATVLIDLFNPRLKGDRRLKLDDMMATFTKSKTKIIIPTPALAELLTCADKARDEYLARIQSMSVFRIEPFADRAAVECAMMLEKAFTSKQKREVTRTKMKFDWQIVAIAKMLQVSHVYTCDADIIRYSNQVGLKASLIDDLPVPDSSRQKTIEYEEWGSS